MPRKRVTPPQEEPIGTGAVDARSLELIAEVRDYKAKSRALYPGQTDRDFFEGWAIQKLAGLQIVVEMLDERIGLLGAEFERRTAGKR